MSKQQVPLRLILGALLMCATACARRLPAFPKMNSATRVQVATSAGEVTTITDPQRVDKVVRFFDDRTTSWVQPWYGEPVGRVRVVVYDGKQVIRDFRGGQRLL